MAESMLCVVCCETMLLCVISFVGSMLTGISSGLTHDLSVKAGLNAAYLSLQSSTAISSQLTPQLLQVENINQWAPWDARVVSM